jgi:hypothetical protein
MGGYNMLKYAMLIRKYMDTLQDDIYIDSIEKYAIHDRKEAEYTYNMDRLYNRLQREHNFNKEKFYALQDQAVMF